MPYERFPNHNLPTMPFSQAGLVPGVGQKRQNALGLEIEAVGGASNLCGPKEAQLAAILREAKVGEATKRQLLLGCLGWGPALFEALRA